MVPAAQTQPAWAEHFGRVRPSGPDIWRKAIPHILAILGRPGLLGVNQKAESSRRE
jgi:hypothetical protein